jgi:hypothetical protein
MNEDPSPVERMHSRDITRIARGELVDAHGVQGETSTSTLQSFEKEISVSLTLLNDSAKHMFESMLELDGPGSVEDACKCAKQIASLARTKIDAMRLLASVKGYK